MFSRRTAWNLTTNRYTDALASHRRDGRELLDLTASNPTTIGLAYPQDALLDSLRNPAALYYDPVAQGLASAREAIANYYADMGVSVSPSDIVLTTSTSEAYSFVFRLLCDPGDAVLVPTQSYPLFDFLADLNDVELQPYELVYDHGWLVDFPSVTAAIARSERQGSRCRAVLVVHPNNPTGSFLKAAEQEQLSALCRSLGLAIVADEVFLDYRLDVSPYASFADHTGALTFTLSGLSKIAALPQMKVAWIATGGPDALKREALARLEVIADTYLSMNAPVQLAVPAMLAARQELQTQLLDRVRGNLATLDQRLASQKLCSRLAVEGGWYAVLRVPALGSDEDLAIALLQKTGVLLQPGHFYNFPSDGYLVASLITTPDVFVDGIDRVLAFLQSR